MFRNPRARHIPLTNQIIHMIYQPIPVRLFPQAQSSKRLDLYCLANDKILQAFQHGWERIKLTWSQDLLLHCNYPQEDLLSRQGNP